MQKFLISDKRREEKRKRDLFATVSIGEFLLTQKAERLKLKKLFSDMPKSWQRKMEKIISKNSKIFSSNTNGVYFIINKKHIKKALDFSSIILIYVVSGSLDFNKPLGNPKKNSLKKQRHLPRNSGNSNNFLTKE